MQEFTAALRGDFRVPSRKALQARVTSLYLRVKERVEERLKGAVVCLIADCWEDKAHFPVFGVTCQSLLTPGKPFLIAMHRLEERQTAAFLSTQFDNVIEYLKTIDCRALVAQADNGSNFQVCKKIAVKSLCFSVFFFRLRYGMRCPKRSSWEPIALHIRETCCSRTCWACGVTFAPRLKPWSIFSGSAIIHTQCM